MTIGDVLLSFSMKTIFKPRKENTITKVMDNPEDYQLIAYIQGDDIIMKITRKEADNDN